ncbi:hypothetical protein SAMN05421810_101312 [Amycolatopsis arida]|uniref:Uncharacterized protein n=1 Tax=Amycolatopsis arida TaxID=587909 RepID=A0A1I5KW08_9PSEU|nr:hypothetical protein [Amycolatopsis arida]TDX85858.1 hypothetical protein CLV69_11437 [Amycolatopsis arida]SFO89177.1 hypothetical protein SAMN05421810_101312 [Amycolatopsis arida]
MADRDPASAGDRPDPPGDPTPTTFAAALRAAIAASGLSLDRIQARLQRHGVAVSVTALSYWQSGKRRPERPSSLAAVRALEEILDVPPGALLGQLAPLRPRRPAAARRAAPERPLAFPPDALRTLLAEVGAPHALRRPHLLDLVALHDRCELADDGGQRAVASRAVFRAAADGQDRWLLVYSQDSPEARPPAVDAQRNCSVGRVAHDAEHGLTVAELLFHRPVDRDETYLVEYTVTNAGPPYPQGDRTHYREFRRPVREYLLEVHFGRARPRRCWRYSRTGPGEPEARRDLRVDAGGAAHAVALDFGPGVFGIAWSPT